jgi:hypothetical protein
MTQLDVPSRRSAPSSPRWARSMRWWAWLLVVVLLVASLAVQVVGGWFIAFAYPTCHSEPLNVANMHTGQLAAFGLSGGVAAVWLVAAAVSRLRVPVVVAGAVSTALGLLIVVWAINPESWTSGWCF